ncbi:MAG TPA: 16S rRNA (adenine(1518)-N(6)/adenine(1519)-N(6))-dimethyltransferase RsmA [Solirubrobacteraceae bacterium]|nr:16S rRNA (adenine(1518)-N(6)/adenine(1519)-N(6))-dimethyltransferase RsmA [Solirubrobacteraceae bacterium]
MSRTRLGQNFLVDPNLLGVIERAARLAAEDVVLEIGGGLGVLSVHLAERVRYLHVVELDQRLPLAQALAGRENVSLHWGDALAVDLAALEPAPEKVVANLPYGIAASAILRTVAELPSVRSWVTMVQREVGERFAAPAGGRVYGVTSVLAQLSCEVRVLRAVPRTVFSPVPNVDSVLLGLERVGPPAPAAVVDLVHGAFAHRRKALARSLSLAAGAPAGVRERARVALVEMGHPADERAERLTPAEFAELAERLRVLRPSSPSAAGDEGPSGDWVGRSGAVGEPPRSSLKDDSG